MYQFWFTLLKFVKMSEMQRIEVKSKESAKALLLTGRDQQFAIA